MVPQICHPISDCSSILFSPPFLRTLQPLHILALSPAPPSASPLLLPLRRPSLFSHPYPHRTFHSHIFVNPPDRQLRTPSPTFSLSLFHFVPLFLPHFSLTHSFPVSLTSPLAVRGGEWWWWREGGRWGLAVMEQDEFLIAVGQRGDLSLVRIKSKEGEAEAAEWGRWAGGRGPGGEKQE